MITDLSANSQWWVKWGVQSRYYDDATTAALFYQAESLSPLGGATAVAGATGASGSGSNVVRQGTLTPGWQAMLSTQAVGAGAHLSHVGSFEVLARVYMPIANTGAVSVALEWAPGDFRRRTTNTIVDFDVNHGREGQYVIARLGQVHIAEGSTRWEGRVIASSTVAGDDLDVDWLMFVPITEGSGELSALLQYENPTSFSARDEFNQTVGGGSDPLTGFTAPVGGVWAGAGDADDFVIEDTGHTAQRTAVSDADPGRIAALPVSMAATVVQVDFKNSVNLGTTSLRHKVLARFADANDYFSAGVANGSTQITAEKKVAGVATSIAAVTVPPFAVDTWYSLRLLVDAAGRWFLWYWKTGAGSGEPILSGTDAVLATGGALASGSPGFRDNAVTATAATRNYDNFVAFVPTADAAIFASQSLELTHEGAEREDSAGAFWSPVSEVQGDYFKLAPGGREGRVNRLVVKASRISPDWAGDPGIDDIQVQAIAIPRGVSIPTP